MGLQSICQLSTWCQINFFSFPLALLFFFCAIPLFHFLSYSFFFPSHLFLFVFNLFLLSHIHYLLLAETQLSAWLITEVLKSKKMSRLARYHRHTSLTRATSCSLFLSSCFHLVSSSHFPDSSMWSHCSVFSWLQLLQPTVSILILFFFFSSTLLPSSIPKPLHFHTATDQKGTTGFLI